MDKGMIALYGMVGFLFVLMIVTALIHEKTSDSKSGYKKKRMRKSLKYRVK